MRGIITDIHANPSQIRQGLWRGGGGNNYVFYEKGTNVVVTSDTGDFVTILRGGVSNGWFQRATEVVP